jgi:16S rRNA (cytidine1402-2'-O)-methyltransferase
MPTLWVVATPLGNLEDITLRALSVLKAVDAIACEDTRHSLKLLNHFNVSKTLLSCHAHREEESSRAIVAWLNGGKDIAYVSDAGTPSLSDPGSKLVRAVLEAGHSVVPVPGPSAFACLMSVAGMGGSSVTFAGFLSPKSGRRKSRLSELLARGEAFVIYESPYRIVRLLADLAELDLERELCLGREMTKIHEEFIRGSARDVLAAIQAKEGAPKGEFSLMVSGKPGTAADQDQDQE